MSLKDKIIDYEKHKEDIEHWALLKGEYRYEKIITFLGSQHIPCNWKNVTNYIKYDKRILINALKYLVFLEELYKSFIAKYGNNKNYQGMYFQKAYYNYLLLGEVANFDGIDLNTMKEYKDSICLFRNNVVHNKVLLGRKFTGCSLEEVLQKIVLILPLSYRDGFVKDINGCSRRLTEDYWHIDLNCMNTGISANE